MGTLLFFVVICVPYMSITIVCTVRGRACVCSVAVQAEC